MSHRAVATSMLVAVLSCPPTVLDATTSLSKSQQSRDQPAKPVRETFFHTNMREKPPERLRGLLDRSHIVVEGVITNATPADELIPGTDPPEYFIVTTYTVAVVTAFKSGTTSSPGGPLLVTRPGGVRDRGDHIYRKVDSDFPLFEVGQRYLLFLKHLRRGEYAPAFGPDSAFLITDGHVTTRGKGPLATQLARDSAESLRSAIIREAR